MGVRRACYAESHVNEGLWSDVAIVIDFRWLRNGKPPPKTGGFILLSYRGVERRFVAFNDSLISKE